jgi:ADP-ribose pyrophosphatase
MLGAPKRFFAAIAVRTVNGFCPATECPGSRDQCDADTRTAVFAQGMYGKGVGMLKSRKHIYDGRVIRLTLDRVQLPNDAQCELEIVHHPGGAAVVAVDDADRVCLIKQYRHAAGGWIWELPAGKLEPDEAPLKTAQRELCEEAGVVAANWQSMGCLTSSPGVFTEVIHLFYATELSGAARNPEEHEAIEVHWWPLSEAVRAIEVGDIHDAKTVIGLYRTCFTQQI